MLSNKERRELDVVRRTPEKHDSIPGKLRTNSTPALEPFSPALSSRLLFPHATRTHVTRTHARTHTRVRAAAENSAATTPRWGTGGRVYGWSTKTGRERITRPFHAGDTTTRARGENRAARRPDYD